MPRLYIVPLLTLLLMSPLIAAPLHYFREDDRVGLKDEAGRVLVPARYPDIGWTVYDEDPQGGEIEFITSIHQPHAADDAPAWAAGDIYDRAGHYLYSPISFDNGMDYWEEGYRRFIEDGKVGFVDGNGRKVIPAQYAAADPFSHGYATVYTGNWRAKWVDGGEHAVLDAVDASAQSHIINQKGETVRGKAQPTSPTDVRIDGRYYPPLPLPTARLSRASWRDSTRPLRWANWRITTTSARPMAAASASPSPPAPAAPTPTTS